MPIVGGIAGLLILKDTQFHSAPGWVLITFCFITLEATWLTTIAFGQVATDTEKKPFENLIRASFDDIWSALDAKNIDKYYTKDFLLLEHGEVWNNDTIANYLNKAILRQPKPKRINTIEIIECKVDNNRAWIAYHNYATFTVDGAVVRKAHWLESVVAVLTAEGWKLEMMHSTRVQRE